MARKRRRKNPAYGNTVEVLGDVLVASAEMFLAGAAVAAAADYFAGRSGQPNPTRFRPPGFGEVLVQQALQDGRLLKALPIASPVMAAAQQVMPDSAVDGLRRAQEAYDRERDRLTRASQAPAEAIELKPGKDGIYRVK